MRIAASHALAAITTLALAAFAVTGAAAAAPGKLATTCNGLAPTKTITNVSQLIEVGDGQYELNGTSHNDVLIVNVALPASANSFDIFLAKYRADQSASIGGGTDTVCVVVHGTDEWSTTTVFGGHYVAVNAPGYAESIGVDHGSVHITSPRSHVVLWGGASTVNVTASPAAQVLNAQISGGSGNDAITVTVPTITQKATVAVNGGEGNDTIAVDAPAGAQTLLIGGGGKDAITSGSSQDLVYGGVPTYNGASDVYTFDDASSALRNGGFASLQNAINPNWTADTSGGNISTGGGNDFAYGTDGYDEIRTGSGNDWADGGRYRDRLWGGTGKDTLYGGPGDDDVYGENDNDTLYGETGNDYLRGNDGADSIDGGTGTDDCSGGAGSDDLKGCNP